MFYLPNFLHIKFLPSEVRYSPDLQTGNANDGPYKNNINALDTG